QVVESRCTGPAVGRDRRHPSWVRRVADDLVATAHQAARHVAAHPTQSYHPDLHSDPPDSAGSQPRDDLQRALCIHKRAWAGGAPSPATTCSAHLAFISAPRSAGPQPRDDLQRALPLCLALYDSMAWRSLANPFLTSGPRCTRSARRPRSRSTLRSPSACAIFTTPNEFPRPRTGKPTAPPQATGRNTPGVGPPL